MEIFWSESLGVPNRVEIKSFLQSIADRLMQGHCRYGAPKRSKKYLTRLKLEIKAYEETGNVENLFNAAVYCGLETLAPQNPLFHYDPTVGSVTRGHKLVDG